MLAIFSTLLIVCVLGLLFESTRLIGIVCAAVLIYTFPIPFLSLVAIAAAIYYFIHHH